MFKSKKVLTGFALMALFASGLSFRAVTYAGEAVEVAPVPVAGYVEDQNPVAENKGEMTPTDIRQYLQQKHDSEALDGLLDDSGDNFRINNFDADTAEGKIVIRVHKSNTTARAEFLEVFRQRSADPSDLDPLLVFDNGQSNQALVSTAGTYGSKVYVTPSGTFAIDSMEEMHYSSKYANAPMPWTMFFNGGIAIHGATPSEYKQLGRKASHGCVRVHPTNARLLFDVVRNDGRKNVVIQVLDK